MDGQDGLAVCGKCVKKQNQRATTIAQQPPSQTKKGTAKAVPLKRQARWALPDYSE
jgi:hypothetical protein